LPCIKLSSQSSTIAKKKNTCNAQVLSPLRLALTPLAGSSILRAAPDWMLVAGEPAQLNLAGIGRVVILTGSFGEPVSTVVDSAIVRSGGQRFAALRHHSPDLVEQTRRAPPAIANSRRLAA